MYSYKELNDRVRFIMQEITYAALRGSALVPTAEDRVYINTLNAELLKLSGGTNEVIFDKLGRPSIYVNIFCNEKARISYLCNSGALLTSREGVHPAFIVDGSAIAGFRVQKFQWCRYNSTTYPVSLYNMEPSRSHSLNTALSLVDTANAGSYDGAHTHVWTLAEAAYLALMCGREGFQPRGNTSYGKSHTVTTEYGYPAGYTDTDSSGNTRVCQIATGTGPTSWYHDGTIFGVADIVGNSLQWVNGCKLYDGKICIYENNNAASESLSASDFDISSSNWKSIMPDGSLVDRNSEGCLGYDYTGSMGNNVSGQIVTSLTPQDSDSDGYIGIAMASLGAAEDVTIPDIMRELTLAPDLSASLSGRFYARTNGERGLRVSGDWNYGSVAGVAYRDFGNAPSYAIASYSCRSASLITS